MRSLDEEMRRQLPESFQESLARTERVPETLVGQRESIATAAAESAGITVRIARRNGRSFMLHKDLRPSRVSLTIENGIVTAVSVA
jgi:hypothetical protein